jgi:hypothetical protein
MTDAVIAESYSERRSLPTFGPLHKAGQLSTTPLASNPHLRPRPTTFFKGSLRCEVCELQIQFGQKHQSIHGNVIVATQREFGIRRIGQEGPD